MSTTVDILSKMSGLSKEQIVDIWKEVKENQRRLDSCVGGHDFHSVPKERRPDQVDWVCKKCDGKVNDMAFKWYRKGLEHGRI